MIESKFNPQTLILESNFFGEITLGEILDYIAELKENKEYPRLLKIKIKGINATANFSMDDLKKIRIENEQVIDNYDLTIIAMIVDTPETTVLSMLYRDIEKSTKYIFNVYSTDTGASTFLDSY